MSTQLAGGCAALVVTSLVACGSGSLNRDGGNATDGAMDGAADSGIDARDAAADGAWPLEECAPYYRDMPWLRVRVDVVGTDIEHAVIVLESTDSAFRAAQNPEDPEGEPYVDLGFPFPLGSDIERPAVGDTVTLLGGMCDGMLVMGYVRILGEGGRLLFEGGSPDCADLRDTFTWGPHLGERANPDAAPCFEELRRGEEVLCCCRTRVGREVILHPDGDSVLVPGEDREVEIGGERYLASAQGSFAIEQAPCEYDRSGVYGSAFVARIAGQ